MIFHTDMVRNWSIRNRVLLMALLPAMLMAVLLGAYFVKNRIDDLRTAQQALGHALARQLAAASIPSLQRGDLAELKHVVNTLLRQPQVESVRIYGVRHHRLLAKAGKFYRNNHPKHSSRRNSEFYFSAPILAPASTATPHAPLGKVHLTLSHAEMSAHLNNIIMRGAGISVVGLCLNLILALLISRSVSDPLQDVIAAVSRFSDGDIHARVTAKSGGELGTLERGINAMADSAERSQQALQEQVEQATAELRETLEAVEIKNVQLDLARKRAVQASKVKSEFLASMSHEVRTPMNAIIGFAHLLSKTALDGAQRDYIETLQKGADSLLRFLDDVLSLSRLEAGMVTQQRRLFDIRALVDETLSLTAAEAYAKELELVKIIDPVIPSGLYGDAVKLSRIIANLVINAVKFTDFGAVTVRVSYVKTIDRRVLLRLTVTDTGIGISETEARLLFQPFSQSQSARVREQSGAGLGLAICKKLTESMGGTISLSSIPEVGSEFTVDLVFDEAESEQSTADLWEPLRDCRVLVYEPNTLAARAFTEQLEARELNITLVTEINEVLDGIVAAKDEGMPYDFVLLCLSYQEMRHCERFENLWQATERPDVLILVNSLDHQVHQQIGEIIGGRCLAKSVDEATLADAMTDLVSGTITQSGASEKTWDFTGLRALVVDDNRINRALMARLLNERGLETFLCWDGASALELAGRQDLDLVMMDLRMPGMDGLETARRLKHDVFKQHDVPIVMVTAGLDENATHASPDLVAGWLGKPFDNATLFNILADALAENRTTDTEHKNQRTSSQKIAELDPDIREMLKEDLPSQCAAIQAAYKKQEWQNLRELVHVVHGIAAFCQFTELRATSRELENTLADGAAEAVATLMPAFDYAVQDIMVDL